MSWRPVCYDYDGTFPGFLTCVFDSYAHREEPMCFLAPEDGEYPLWECRRVDTDRVKAGRVYRSIPKRMSTPAARLVYRAFLTCLPQRELHMWHFLRYGYEKGPEIMRDLADQRVYTLNRAVHHLEQEAHLYTGFVRFSDYEGVLIGEIEPKNRVLPLLRGHFVGRYNAERLILHDRTHREALVYQPGRSAIVPLEELSLGPAEEGERRCRALWRRFFDTVAIEGRYNPRCQNTHLPKRYRGMMTEFQGDDGEWTMAAPERERPPK